MSTQLQTPEERECERCGRREEWDPDSDGWRIARIDGERRIGSLHCIHEWDINGTFDPIETE